MVVGRRREVVAKLDELPLASGSSMEESSDDVSAVLTRKASRSSKRPTAACEAWIKRG